MNTDGEDNQAEGTEAIFSLLEDTSFLEYNFLCFTPHPRVRESWLWILPLLPFSVWLWGGSLNSYETHLSVWEMKILICSSSVEEEISQCKEQAYHTACGVERWGGLLSRALCSLGDKPKRWDVRILRSLCLLSVWLEQIDYLSEGQLTNLQTRDDASAHLQSWEG